MMCLIFVMSVGFHDKQVWKRLQESIDLFIEFKNRYSIEYRNIYINIKYLVSNNYLKNNFLTL